MPPPKKKKRKTSIGNNADHRKKSVVFEGKKFLVSNVYSDELQKEYRRFIQNHGGTVVKGKPTRKVDYLVQGWEDDDCDERLEMCCRYDVMAVSYDYLKACVKALTLVPLHLFGLKKSQKSSNVFMNPLIDISPYTKEIQPGKCLLGLTSLGNVDDRCRETEEINQTISEYVGQKWPKVKSKENRNVIYVFSFVTKEHGVKKNRARQKNVPVGQMVNDHLPTYVAHNPRLQQIMKDFLNAYFDGCKTQGAKDEALHIKKKIVMSHGIRIRHAMNGKAKLLNVLDLLDVCAEKLPSDAYCILGITDQDIYEYDGDDQVPVEYLDGCMRGRAFGGSRIAVFSTACYGRSINSMKKLPSQPNVSSSSIYKDFVYQLSTLAHETMHCFGLDHCGLYMCCMNSWNDTIVEFAKLPLRDGKKVIYNEDDVGGSIHVCPLCLRKLQITCGFDICSRYMKLLAFYESFGFEDQARWVKYTLEVGEKLLKGKG